jgi:hypothetical protein
MQSPKIISLVTTSIIVLFLIGCATVDYVGDSYPATSNVDIYYSNEQVAQNFEIFGHAVGYREDHNTIISKLIIDAKAKGADAIIITGIDVDNADISSTKKVEASLIKYLK